MPKPMSKAHMAVSYEFAERRVINRYLRQQGQTPKISKKLIKKIANRGDRKQSRLELSKLN